MVKQNMYNKRYCISTVFAVLLICLLAGAASAQSMNTALTKPGADPYCDGNYGGIPGTFTSETPLCIRVGDGTTDNEALTIPAAVVDWVLIELRAVTTPTANNSNDATAATIIARKPAFLLANGRVVDAVEFAGTPIATTRVTANCTNLDEHEDCPDLAFEGDISSEVDGTALYVVVRHRNHLDVISNTTLTEVSGIYQYDFTDIATKARGSKLTAKSGTFAMIAGDLNNDSNVDAADYTGSVVPALGEQGYFSADANMDTNVDASDYTGIIAVNAGQGGDIPP